MKKLWYVLGLLLVCIGEVCSSEAASISSIGGMNVDASVPPTPSGLCSGGRTLTLTDQGSVVTAITMAGGGVFKAASTENSNGGIGYALGADGAGNTRLFTYDLDITPAVLLGNVLVNTASVPDLAAAPRANFYDMTRVSSGGFINVSTQITAPCTAGLANCLHIRGYTNTTTIIDIVDTSSIGSNGALLAYAVGTDEYWVAYSTAGGSILNKYNSGLTKTGAIAVTPNQYLDLAYDDTYVYTTLVIGGVSNIRRIHRTTLAVTDTPVFGASTINAIYRVDGNLYVGVVTAGTGSLQRVNIASMTVTGTIVFGAAEMPIQGGLIYDTANLRLYVVSTDGATTTYKRVNLTTFLSEQSIGVALNAQAFGTGFDIIHQRIWQVSAVGATTFLTKIGLCS